eukprot:451218-Pyramimonas_sp.AAC.1
MDAGNDRTYTAQRLPAGQTVFDLYDNHAPPTNHHSQPMYGPPHHSTSQRCPGEAWIKLRDGLE